MTCNADSTSALDADSTCSGNGICLENGTCQCNDGYYGTDCSNVGYDLYFNGKFCEKSITCSNRGECNTDGICDCYNDDEHGYYIGDNCNSCVRLLCRI